MRGSLIIIGGLLLATACIQPVDGSEGDGTGGDGSGSADAGTAKDTRTKLDSVVYCNLAVNQCQLLATSVSACVAEHDIVRVSTECATRLAKATCNDILDVNALCFPPCQTSASTCNIDGTLTSCEDALTVTISCADGCHANAATYSGTCGTKDPNTGEVSTTAKCWCK